jgi:small subunit ribosomal protein S4
MLNDRPLSIPSAVVRAGDRITVKERKATKDLVRRLLADNSSRPIPPWLVMSRDDMIGSVQALPTRDVIPTIAEEQLVIEFYSK